MGMPFLLGTDYLRKIQSVRPQNLVSLWPQNEPLGHGVSTEIVRGYDGAYTAVTLGQTGLQGSGLTSAGYDGATSFNDIHSAGLANDNPLLNPGFETPGGAPPVWANWAEQVGDGALANEVVIVHEGTDAAKITAGATANTIIYQGITVVPGVRYRLRFWTQGDGATAGRYRIHDLTNAADIVAVTTTGVTAAAWGMVATEFTAPAGCTDVRLYFYCPLANGGIAYFDACEIRRMDGFQPDQGTIIIPAQVSGVGVWTDAAFRTLILPSAGVGNNNVLIRRTNVNNQMSWRYRAGGVIQERLVGGLAALDWMWFGITWDIAAGATGEVRAYYQGVQQGATMVGLGTWIGDIAAGNAVIGASSTVPAQVWSGNIAPVPIWSAALSPDEMRYLGE